MAIKISRRQTLALAASTALAGSAGLFAAQAQDAGDQVRKIILFAFPQNANPQSYQASQLVAQTWRRLGLDVEVRPIPWQQHSQVVWNERERWDTTMWRMVGRPERSDPDELAYNLFRSDNIDKGYNFVGWNNKEYDELSVKQRQAAGAEDRKKALHDMQKLVDREQPYGFLVHPKWVMAFNANVFDEKTIVKQSGIGLRSFWTFTGATPTGAKKDIVINSGQPLNAVHPLWVSGGTDSWMTELVWDRLVRIGADGLPKPWAAEKFEVKDSTTVEVTLRQGMTFSDGKPVTMDDVMFSYLAPLQGTKVPMYRPFVADIASIDKVSETVLRFKLKAPNAAFVTTSLAKMNIIPKHIWEPVLASLEGKPENIESVRDISHVGSGPYKLARARLSEEIVLERNAAHFAAPKAERLILRIIPNVEAVLGMLRSGEINMLTDYGGDPEVIEKLSKDNPHIRLVAEVDLGFEFVAFNHRRAPFNDTAFRRALSLSLDRKQMVNAGWGGYAVTANSHISPSLAAWHDNSIDDPKSGLDLAKEILDKAGYKVVGGRLRYPAGAKENLKPGE